MASRWYRNGKISVAANSKSVSGIATYWKSSANKPMPGDALVVAGQYLEIESIESDGSLSLFDAYQGAPLNNADYAIAFVNNPESNTRIAHMATEVINKLGNKVTVSTSAPSAGQGQDGDIWIVVSAE